MRIALGSDHRGFAMKQDLARRLAEAGHTVFDLGTHDDEPVDHPDFAAAVARAIADGRADRGIVVAATGSGPCIAANKIAGVRAAAPADALSARIAVADDDANVLCLGSQVTGPALAWDVVEAFLAATFGNDERNRRRLRKLEELEAAAP